MYTQRRPITHVNYLDTNGTSMRTGFDARLCQMQAMSKDIIRLIITDLCYEAYDLNNLDSGVELRYSNR